MSNASNWVQCGREFSTREIEKIRETVSWLPGLARGELVATVCEHLEWHTVAGTPKIQVCQTLLERLEAAKLVELPTIKRKKVPKVNHAGIVLSERTATITPLSCPLRDIEPVHLEIAADATEVGLWNEYVERFHPPLLSEFLDYAKGDTDNHKQDCEQCAFHRLSERLKQLFPRLPILLLLDGLYANFPPIFSVSYRWVCSCSTADSQTIFLH